MASGPSAIVAVLISGSPSWIARTYTRIAARAIGLSTWIGATGMRCWSCSVRSAFSRTSVRSTAKAGMTTVPPRFRVRVIAAAIVSIWDSTSSCSRSPYVDSITIASASSGGCGGARQRVVPAAEVAAEHDGAPVGLVRDRHDRRAEDVPGVVELRGHAGDRVEVDLELHGSQHRDRALGVVDVVQGLGLRVPGEALLARPRGVLVLQLRAVAQDDRDELGAVGRAVHRSVEAVTHERGEVAAVVQVGVGEHDAGDRRGITREGIPVA